MDVFKLKGVISVDNGNADAAIDETTSRAGKLADKFGNGLGTAAKLGAKVASAAVAAAGTAVVAVTKQAVENYSEYEQLVGGVDTLFKDSSRTVQDYAANAYKTAGLSANDYMETVTSFSASLLQSLGGDTAQAAEVANMAITDMSDNANKMGSDMQSIQDAYQGFAKQNYTMLDNLKLGYGGTKGEMERLIADANELKEATGEVGDLSIESYADICEAIHLVQDEMGITGTTAKEAATTIQGSIGSAKAAWENWLTALGDGNADVKAKTDELINAIGVALQNILPVFQQVLTSLGEALAAKLPELFGQAATLIITNLPQILLLGIQLIAALIDGILQGLLQAALTVETAVRDWFDTTIAEPFTNKMSEIAEAVKEGLRQTVEDIKNDAELLKSKLVEVWEAIKTNISEALESIKTTASTAWEAIKTTASTAWEGIKTAISTALEGIKTTASTAWQSIKTTASTVWEGIKTAISTKVESLKTSLSTAWESIKSTASTAFSTLKTTLTKPFTEAWNTISGIVNKIKSAISSVGNGVASALSGGGVSVAGHAAGGIMTKPTIFGYTPSTSTYHLGGEAGPEAIAPIGVLQGYVAAAVASQNNGIAAALNNLARAVYNMDQNMGKNLKNALDGTKLSVNNREFARMVKGVT